MRKSIYILGMFFLMLFATSCLDGEESSTLISDEAKITSFYLMSDSVEGISDYVFTIDNDSMLIYNYDSIEYGTSVDSLSFIVNPKFSSLYINDTLNYYALSGVFLDFTKDVKFTVVASDEKTSADYIVRVNVHQVDPDTFIWKGIDSEVFVGEALSSKAICLHDKLFYLAIVGDKLVINNSVDGESWSVVEPLDLSVDLTKLDLNYLVSTNDYMYFFCEGKIYVSEDGVDWEVKETSGVAVERILFAMNDKIYGVTESNSIAQLNELEWVDLGELPSKFPIEGAAVLVADAPSGKSRVFVVGGIDKEGNYLSSVWSSEDGSYWSDMTGSKELFTPRAYAAVTQYGGGLMLFGGVAEDGQVVKDAQLYSKDFGLNWGEPKEKSKIDSLYLPRYEHSVVVTSSGYIYLIGGRVSEYATINDVWRGLNYASIPGFRK